MASRAPLPAGLAAGGSIFVVDRLVSLLEVLATSASRRNATSSSGSTIRIGSAWVPVVDPEPGIHPEGADATAAPFPSRIQIIVTVKPAASADPGRILQKLSDPSSSLFHR
jgi:hypothetical protein